MIMVTLTTARSLARRAVIPCALVTLFGLFFWLFGTGEIHTRIPLLSGKATVSVTIPQGTYLGIEAKSDFPRVLQQFLGIPYAKSTEGERRFLPPISASLSKKTFLASKYGNRCPGGDPGDTPQTEDCLNLNIFRPKERVIGKLLPVLIYIHGGAFNFGYGHTREIANMVGWSSEPFLGISFNYRLGAFGFLPSSLMAREGLLNIGLKDQALLLEWVRKNIAAFGGNPDAVTIMGSSAGAHSIGHHLMRPFNSTPPFQKAILESGAATARAVYRADHPMHEEQFQAFIAKLGLSSVPKDRLISKLREKDTLAIKTASEAVFNTYDGSIRWPFQPVIDGEGGMIPVAPIDAWESGTRIQVPILTGFNTNEGAMFVPKDGSTNKDFIDFFQTLLPSLSELDLEVLETTYPDPESSPKYRETRPDLGTQFTRMEQAYGHFAYVAPVRQTARYVAAADGERAPVYLYHFAVNSSVLSGADHGDHSGFVTNDKDLRERSDSLREVAGSMHDYWTSFITKGDPNVLKGLYPDRRTWPVYTTAHQEMVVFGQGNDENAGGGNRGTAVSLADNSWALEECQYWWNRTKLFER